MAEIAAILDCGGQYTKVIDRKVRELGVKTEIFPINVKPEKLGGFGAIILSGGPSSVWADSSPRFDSALLELGVPVLGICYGMQLIDEYFGGSVRPGKKCEYGVTEASVDVGCPLFDGLSGTQRVLMSHGDSVVRVADGFSVCAKSEGVIAGIYDGERKIYAVQFHPEVELTENGVRMLENFLRSVAGFTETYALEDRLKTSVEMIKNKVGDSKVMVLVSGGVDSAVTAALLLRALPAENIYAIHVDHGLMRKGESDRICENLKKLGLKNLKRVNAEETFFNSPVDIGGGVTAVLSRQTDPEIKRRIIGTAFINVTREACEEFGLDFEKTYIAQGTLRPDLIESGNPDVSGFAHKIKTHHNDVDVVRAARERGMIVETNWDWHKDEVRKIALMLGLDEEIAYRQPFPGPGLGVRIICADGPVEVTDAESGAFDEFMADYPSLSGALAPVRSVGVQGDCRSYRKMAFIAGGSMSDALKAAAELPNRLDFVNRVLCCLDRSSLSGAGITVTPTYINHETAELLREIDDIATRAMKGKNIAQCFAVLLPVCSDGSGRRSVALRAVVTGDFMTARAAEIGRDINEASLYGAVSEIRERFGDKIDIIAYDITGKPPATVEFE